MRFLSSITRDWSFFNNESYIEPQYDRRLF